MMSSSVNLGVINEQEQQLSAIVKDFFAFQSAFYHDILYLTMVLTDKLVLSRLNNSKRDLVNEYLKPYMAIVRQKNYFNMNPSDTDDDIKKILSMFHPDNTHFFDFVEHVKSCILQLEAFNAFMAKLSRRHMSLYKYIANKLSGATDLDRPYDPVIVSSTLIKPLQHFLRFDLFLSRLQECFEIHRGSDSSDAMLKELIQVREYVSIAAEAVNNYVTKSDIKSSGNVSLFKSKSTQEKGHQSVINQSELSLKKSRSI